MTLSNTNIRQAAAKTVSILDAIVYPKLPIPPIEWRSEWRKEQRLVRQNAVSTPQTVSDGITRMADFKPNNCRCRVWSTGKGAEAQCSYTKKHEKYGGTCTRHKNMIDKDNGFKLGFYNEPRPEWWHQKDDGKTLKETQLAYEMKHPIRWKMPYDIYRCEFTRMMRVGGVYKTWTFHTY